MRKVESLENILYFLIRLAAAIFAVIILGVNIVLLLREYRYDKIFTRLILGYRFICTIMTEFFLIIFIIFPYKFEAVAVFAFLYTGVLLYADPLNPLSVLIYFLGFVSLYIRGLLKKKRLLKSCLISAGIIVMEKNKVKQNNCVLDLTLFPDLTQRDREWIEMALSQEKYDTIARQYNLSPNYVKNRMRIIFKILEVPDRLALIAKYSGYDVKK